MFFIVFYYVAWNSQKDIQAAIHSQPAKNLINIPLHFVH